MGAAAQLVFRLSLIIRRNQFDQPCRAGIRMGRRWKPVTTYSGSVTMAIGTNPGSGTLSGTTTKSRHREEWPASPRSRLIYRHGIHADCLGHGFDGCGKLRIQHYCRAPDETRVYRAAYKHDFDQLDLSSPCRSRPRTRVETLSQLLQRQHHRGDWNESERRHALGNTDQWQLRAESPGSRI